MKKTLGTQLSFANNKHFLQLGSLSCFTFLFICFISCGSHDKSSANADCPSKKITVLPKPNIQEVNIFLEVSGSMKGFMPTNSTSDFQLLIPNLIDRFRRDLPNVNFLSLAQQNKPISRFTKEDIAYGRFSFGTSSTLPVMLDSILANLGRDKVSVLITDAIYTPVKDKLKLREQAITDISSIASMASKNGYIILCLQLRSQFEKTISPYYLFVVGDLQNVGFIREELKKSINSESNKLTQMNFNEIQFGNTELSPFYTIIPYTENTGAGEPRECPDLDNRYLIMDNVNIKKTPEFWVGFNLSNYPNFVEAENYLKNNFIISTAGLKAIRVDKILSKTEFSPKASDPVDKVLFEKCSHFIRIKISELDEKTGEINLSLKKVRPEWINLYTHSLADSAEIKRNQTFGLDNIMAGLEDAYQNTESGFFFKDLKIIVNKN